MSDKQIQDNFDFLFSFSFIREFYKNFGIFGDFVKAANYVADMMEPDENQDTLSYEESMEKFTDFITSFRRQIRSKVSQSNYDFQVFDWNVPDILDYCRRIDNIQHRRYYLIYIVREYQNYENMARDSFDQQMNRIMKSNPNIIIEVLRGMYRLVQEQPNLKNIVIPLNGKSNLQLLIEELSYVNMLQQESGSISMSEIKKSLMEANRETPEPDQNPKEATPTEFLTVAEAAQLLKVTPQTIYARRKKGELQATKVGRKVLIDKSEINRLLGTD